MIKKVRDVIREIEEDGWTLHAGKGRRTASFAIRRSQVL
jgi:predicted RNA binding protein YcfA (HicA-like mRNA interferase family)